METTLDRPANHLADETSPYLLQHARNPVDWYPWGPEALAKAAAEDKPILVSIGYSSCHWCHVMERESFEDEDVARVMNERFVCIKVDREERPDLDQVYMTAVQLITRQGGWPLNCFALPDGRPIHGGTYFPRAQWIRTLIEISDFWRRSPDEAREFADRLAQGVRETSLVAPAPEDTEFSFDTLIATVEPWKSRLDWKLGGDLREQNKFPMPDNWRFLGRYARARKDARIEAAWETTLDRIAHGGIYDQIGGGFARYSTDKYWVVPHFEKMLYDNAQLVGLYSEAWRLRGKPAWRRVVEETLGFVRREMTTPEGAFCSALDADSEGEEGRFYVWTRRELVETLGDLEPIASAAWSATDQGNWEDGKNILHWPDDEETVARRLGLPHAELEAKLRAAKEKLLARRAGRVRPELDDKVLTSWNALMSKGYLEAYDAFGDPGHLEAASRNLDFLLRELRPEGRLLHAWRAGKGRIPAFLEDYAALADALVALYEATFDERRLHQARDLVEEAVALFHDPATGLFYLSREEDLLVRQMEIHDNVIPSSNSILARVMHRLSIHLGEARYAAMAARALTNVVATMPQYGSAFSSWGMLMLDLVRPPAEIAVLGPDALSFRSELARRAPPGSVLAGSAAPGSLPLLRDRFPASGTAIHVCRDRACQPPVATVEEALALLA